MDPRLWRASPAMRRYLVATVLCGLLITACAIVAAVITGHVVAGIITDPAARNLPRWRTELVALAVVWTVRTLAQWLLGRLSQRAASDVIAELSDAVLRSVTALAPKDLAGSRESAATVLTTGLDGLRPYFTGYLPALVLAALLTPATIAVLAVVDARSALIAVVALPLIPVFMILIGLATAQRSAAALEAMTDLHARLMDLVAGLPTLRALGRADGPAERIAGLADAHRRTTMATLRIAFLSALVLELVATLGVALVAVGIGLRLVFGEMTLAAGLTALLLAPEVFWPLRRVGVEFHAAQNGSAAAEKAFELIGTKSPRPPGVRTVDAGGAVISLESLSVVGRDGSAPDQLSARIEPGQLTVLTGLNGAGKSTTLQVIAGLTIPTSGRVTVDNVDIGDLELPGWWHQLAWLAQPPVVIPGTIRANLELFGELDDLESACRTAGFDEVLANAPDGLATIIGYGGVGLSRGQRQRLGLARTLGSRAPLLLLDEPTAHLDDSTEAKVLGALRNRARTGATVMVVTHRENIIAEADAVIRIKANHRAPA